MPAAPIIADDYRDAVNEWFARLSRYCSSVDYASARAIFAEDVVSFGTKAEVVTGLDRLVVEQWQGIWPNIVDFAIDMASVRSGGNERTAWGVAVWNSTGYDEQGRPFHRPGRATIVLQRASTDDVTEQRRRGRAERQTDRAWLCVHSHFSLSPGTPQRTFGKPAARKEALW